VTLSNCVVSFLVAFGFAYFFKFSIYESICIGLALMFSSTILVVKLLPTTTLHQRHMGEACIGVLILEDLIAICVLIFIRCLGASCGAFNSFALLMLKMTIFLVILFAFDQFVLRKIMLKTERLHESLFILGLAWCFGIAAISKQAGLFYETGAFFAGVVLARHPISFFMSEKLKPIRDFFLVLFFFTLGAKLNLFVMKGIFIQALVVTAAFILLKPWLFKKVFILTGESPSFAKEIGIRLGQLSEFSLLIAIMAFSLGHISIRASQFIQLVAILSFIVSCYIVVLKYPTPIGTSEKLRKD
jgi:Kef-type K+ transport system membrane component KefB